MIFGYSKRWFLGGILWGIFAYVMAEAITDADASSGEWWAWLIGIVVTVNTLSAIDSWD